MVLLILILIDLVCFKLLAGYKQFPFQQTSPLELPLFRLHHDNGLVVNQDCSTLPILSVIQMRVWQ